jgi:hypothetical protein
MMPRARKDSSDSGELRELLIGTWTGIVLIAEILINGGALRREDIVSALSDAERLARDRRRISLTALRKLMEMGPAERQSICLAR